MPIANPAQLSVVVTSTGGLAVVGFPDVCKLPAPPAPFVPIPYPSLAGPSQVKSLAKVAGQTVMTKDSSATASKGDGAGSATGVTSNKVAGKAEFTNYSFDVKFEGKGVSGAFDTMLHNNASAASQAKAAQLRSRLQAITSQLSALPGGNPKAWHTLVDEYVLVSAELYLQLTPT